MVPLLLILAVAVSAVSAIITALTQSRNQHTLLWSSGTAIAAFGLLLVVLRGKMPDFGSILLGNCFLLMGEALISCGASSYIGRRVRLDVLFGAIAIGAFALAYFSGSDHHIRVIIYSASCSFFSFRVASAFFQAKRGAITYIAGCTAMLLCLVEFLRAALVYADVVTLDGKQSLSAVSMSFGVPIALGLALAVAILNREYFLPLFGVKRPAAVPEIETLTRPASSASWILPLNRSVLVSPEGVEVRLTGNEYMILQKLGDVRDAVDRLSLNAVIGRSQVDPKDRGIDILFSRLRRKCLEAGIELPVNALRGRGYVFLGDLQRL